jgi:integrase/recombinase XerD
MEKTKDRLWTLLRTPEGPLAPYFDSFAQMLDAQGFKRHLLSRQIRDAAKFSRWLQMERVGLEAVTDEHIQRFLRDPKQLTSVRQGTGASLRRMMDFLRQRGATSRPEAPCELTPIQKIVAEYVGYLRREQGLSDATLIQYSPFAERFLSECFGVGPVDLGALRAGDVVGFVQQEAERLSPARAKAATIALRSFLRYVRYRGESQLDLVAAVPAVPNWSMTAIPRAIAPDHLRAALAHCHRDTPVGRRDYAILMLLARLGLRSSEIVALTLDSIDWEGSSIAVVGKGDQPARLPLPADVGEAIAQYLQKGRPASSDRSLFLRALAPIRGLGAQQTIATIVGAALTRAGVDAQHRGAHQFRHALATDMLRQGATLSEIGSLLRHQHSKTTSIYAKVDFAALRPLSLPWPGGAI